MSFSRRNNISITITLTDFWSNRLKSSSFLTGYFYFGCTDCSVMMPTLTLLALRPARTNATASSPSCFALPVHRRKDRSSPLFVRILGSVLLLPAQACLALWEDTVSQLLLDPKYQDQLYCQLDPQVRAAHTTIRRCLRGRCADSGPASLSLSVL